MPQLAPKNILRMLRYIGQNGISGHKTEGIQRTQKALLKLIPATLG